MNTNEMINFVRTEVECVNQLFNSNGTLTIEESFQLSGDEISEIIDDDLLDKDEFYLVSSGSISDLDYIVINIISKDGKILYFNAMNENGDEIYRRQF